MLLSWYQRIKSVLANNKYYILGTVTLYLTYSIYDAHYATKKIEDRERFHSLLYNKNNKW